MTLEEHIRRYLELVDRADRLFNAVAAAHPELIACQPGCDDCCAVYFQLSLVEAFYISGIFRQEVPDAQRERALEKARTVRPLFSEAEAMLSAMASPDAVDDEQIQDAAARLTIPCPLNEDQGCILYRHRPITCRLYGTPEKIGNRIVACPRSGFRGGTRYTTVDVNEIQRRLIEYSREFLLDLAGVAPSGPPGLLFSMPVAIENNFDRDFFLSLRQRLL
jgi:Fe-S-cluster containining protein